jgi:rhodanese-related sulfurtransferase
LSFGSLARSAKTLRHSDGYENVRMLHGGFNEWKARGGMQAYAKASRKN